MANRNVILSDGFSNPESDRRYTSNFAGEPDLYERVVNEALQCGGCAFFAPLNADYGLCLRSGRTCQDGEPSPHYLETVFEHFGCAKIEWEGWGRHSFTAPPMGDDICDECRAKIPAHPGGDNDSPTWCDICNRMHGVMPCPRTTPIAHEGERAAYLRGWHDRGEADARIAISRPNAPSQCCDYTAADIYDAIRALPPPTPREDAE